MVVVAGVEYITAGEACYRLDVGRETLRNWYAPRRPGARPLVRLLRTPAGAPVREGREYLVAWADCVEAEYHTGHAVGGRPRTTSMSANACAR